MEKTEIDIFLADHCAYFGHSLTRMMSISREDFDKLQLYALQRRFEHLRNSIPMLEKLADRQGVTQINSVHDVAPLLFDHATYKSYPASFLEKRQFKHLTGWLNKLTTHDLSGIDISHCRSIDEWLLTLDDESPLAVFHTSSTSGTMSFLPWAKQEIQRFMRQQVVLFFQTFGEESAAESLPLNVHCIYPYFRSGGLSHTQLNDSIAALIAGSEERFHALFPGRLNADMVYFAAKLRAAKAKGQLDRLEITPELRKLSSEFEELHKNMGRHSEKFFADICTKLRGRRVFIQATDNLLYSTAETGLKQGNRKVFSPNTVIVTGGGGKGGPLPDNWREKVMEFFGVDRINNGYGMSEGGLLPECEHGHYHSLPSQVPFVLDPDTSEPLPRKGVVTGRFAFFTLTPDTRWGGFITGDEVTMDWDTPCPCGRTTPFLTGTIRRYSDMTGDDDKITCGGQAGAYDEAIDFLNEIKEQ